MQRAQNDAAASIKNDIDLQQLRFRYAISGDTPPWRPLRAFDDGQRVFIQFPDGYRARRIATRTRCRRRR
jgi:type IV secretion system protein TrbG